MFVASLYLFQKMLETLVNVEMITQILVNGVQVAAPRRVGRPGRHEHA